MISTIKKYWWIFCLVLGIAAYKILFTPSSIEASKMTLIPRHILFDNPEKASVHISPNGHFLTYLAPQEGILNIWVQDFKTNKVKVITQDKKRGIRNYGWAYDNQHILYIQDDDGDENWRLYKVNVNTHKETLLTPGKGIQARIMASSHYHPNEIIIGLNDRNHAYHDLYKINIESGEKKLILQNDEFASFTFDHHFNIILAAKDTPNGGFDYYSQINNKWELYRHVSFEDTLATSPIEIDASNQWIYWTDSEGSDKANLTKIHLNTKERHTVATAKQADISDVFIHPTSHIPLYIKENYLKNELIPLNDDILKDLEIIREKAGDAEFSITSTTLDFNTWVIVFHCDDQPHEYYLYNRINKSLTYLFCNNSKWKNLLFVKMQPLEIQSRDGLKLVSYLSVPKSVNQTSKPIPLVLVVHGGPTARDEWGMNATHQWLANRGYAVLSVNYRGSTGFGKAFLTASVGEWAGKMHDDLIDAAQWAIDQKIADPSRIAIFGGSYGGYATLVGLTMTPDFFACGVDIVGPSNLITLMESIPPYWKSFYEDLKKRIGADPATEKGKEFLKSRSPINYVHEIRKPLLIAQGANDVRVKKAEADQIAQAMADHKIPYTYILFPDEGHGFVRPVNRIANTAIIEKFLHDVLGGAHEPVTDEIEKSTVQYITF